MSRAAEPFPGAGELLIDRAGMTCPPPLSGTHRAVRLAAAAALLAGAVALVIVTAMTIGTRHPVTAFLPGLAALLPATALAAGGIYFATLGRRRERRAMDEVRLIIHTDWLRALRDDPSILPRQRGH